MVDKQFHFHVIEIVYGANVSVIALGCIENVHSAFLAKFNSVNTMAETLSVCIIVWLKCQKSTAFHPIWYSQTSGKLSVARSCTHIPIEMKTSKEYKTEIDYKVFSTCKFADSYQWFG